MTTQQQERQSSRLIKTSSAPLETAQGLLRERLEAFKAALPRYSFTYLGTTVVAVKVEGFHKDAAACILEPASVAWMLSQGVPMNFYLRRNTPHVHINGSHKAPSLRTGSPQTSLNTSVARLVMQCGQNEVAKYQIQEDKLDLRLSNLEKVRWYPRKRSIADVHKVLKQVRLEQPYRQLAGPEKYLVNPEGLKPGRPWIAA